MIDDPPITLALIVCDRGGPGLRRTLLSAVDRSTGNEWDEVTVVGVPRLPVLPLAEDRVAPQPSAAADWTALTADYLVFLPAGAILTTNATNDVRDLVRHNPDIDFAYFDSAGFRDDDPTDLSDASHRPGFSPDRLRSQMYLGEMFLVRRSLATAFDPEGDALCAPLPHSVAGRLTARCDGVAHLPRVLYLVPDDGFVAQPDLAAHQQWLQDVGFPATAVARPGSTIIDLEPQLSRTPKVSIIMPSNGGERLLDGAETVLCLQAVESIVARTGYVDYELVMVLTPGASADLADRILAVVKSGAGPERPAVRFCRDDRAFNFSNACNRGAVAAAGEVLVFLNDDTVVGSGDWIDRLVMYATRPEVGAVGARLLYGDGSIQHAGIWSRGGHPAHRYERFPAQHRGYLDSLLVPQNCLAVTGACLAVEADKFHRVGGFSPEFPSSYNDVDLCLKLDDLGHRTVVDPAIVLTHFEASSRDPKIDDWELSLLHERWRSVVVDDPFDNPHHLAPAAEEYPPPDAVISEQKRLAGWVDFLPRIWPRATLTAEVTSC